MLTLIAIGFCGGLITGISPCILPVLPVIFFSTAYSGRSVAAGVHSSESTGVVAPPRSRSTALRPYMVIAGLVVSFSAVTLLGSLLPSLLHLPPGAIRWVAMLALVAIGVGLIVPRFEALLDKPFARLPQKQFGWGNSGFGLGLALGALYVPCAGPVLTAIVFAGATGSIGLSTIALTLSFAVGTALPLLCFALAGRRISERVGAFRRHQRTVRVAAGVVMILLAVALVFNLAAVPQRAIPDYTGSLQHELGAKQKVRQKLNLGGIVNDQNAGLSNCTDGATELESCGAAPDLKGITQWLNTPGGAPVNLMALRGNVVLIDFWAYSCINCQRSIPHVVGWYNAYHDKGLEVIGVHTPEYAFERQADNVASAAAQLGIRYPVALDNGYATWTNFRNRYWPAHYLIDAHGAVRHIKFGEGDYDVTEKLIRQLLADADKSVSLPNETDKPDTTPTAPTTPETYFGVGKVVNYGGQGPYDQGSATFTYPRFLADNCFALRGRWALDYQGAIANGDGDTIALNYHAHNVYLVVGGTGIVTVTRGAQTVRIPVSGPPSMRPVVIDDPDGHGHIEVALSTGLQAFSFTYG